MTGSEMHAVVFTAQIRGEVVPGATQPTMSATLNGTVTFVALFGAQVPFTGTMTGTLSGATVPNGAWQAMGAVPQPSAGDGTWQASRQ